MLKKFSNYMRNHLKKIKIINIFTILLLHSNLYADPPFNDPKREFLQLSNGTWLRLKKIDWEKTEFIYGRGKGNEKKLDIIWSKIYESNNERAWPYAYFLRIKPGRFVYDLDGDGNKEVALSTYDMGNNMVRDILIFTILKDKIVFKREHGPYNIGADEPVFK
jgi:hypothetical protein